MVHAMARKLGGALLGPASRERNLALALIVSRVVRPGSKLSTVGWGSDVTLGADLGVADACPGEVYAAMDWLLSRQDDIEAELARRHLSQGGMAMFDLSSSWMEGSDCELAERGTPATARRARRRSSTGARRPVGRPVAIRVFAGNTGDPKAFIEAVEIVRDKFGLSGW